MTEHATDHRPAAVIVLAAGEGTRMKSATPKVLHHVGGRSLLSHVLTAAANLNPQRIAVVVRHGREAIVEHVTDLHPDILIADQDDVPGTGRAVQCALSVLDAAGMAALARDGAPAEPVESDAGQITGPVVVLSGDVPMVDGATLAELISAHLASNAAATVLSASLADPTGYGRIVREAETGAVARIVEESDATDAQREITEVNSGTFVFDAAALRDALNRLDRNNAQGEMYLTDVIEVLGSDGEVVRAVQSDDEWVAQGVNDRVQLAAIAREVNRRAIETHMLAGVTVIDPATTWVDADVELGTDVTLLPNTQLHGACRIADGASIGPDTTLTDVEVGEGARVYRTHGSQSRIGAHAEVGPFTYLRPGTVLGDHGKIGTFVETKNAEIGAGSKVPHLSYVGDATVGEGTNIGAATIFVNFDGVNKHRSTVGSHARTGAANMFVAPINIGDGAYSGAGTVIRHDVPPGALAVGAGAQRNIEGWVLRRRSGTPAAEAAASALADDETSDPNLSAQARAELARAQAHEPQPHPPQQGEPSA